MRPERVRAFQTRQIGLTESLRELFAANGVCEKGKIVWK